MTPPCVPRGKPIPHVHKDGQEKAWCSGCERYRTLGSFGKDSRRWDGIQRLCKRCSRERQKRHRETRGKAWRLRRYGLTPEDHQRLLEAQGGACAICTTAKGISKALAVDHDHATLDIRGLLCTRCNVRLGWFEAFGEAVLAYLQETPAQRAGVHVKAAPGEWKGGGKVAT